MIRIEEFITLILAFLAMCVVIYLSYVASKYIAKKSWGSSSSKYIKIIDRAAVGREKSLIITQIGEKYFLVAISENRMEKLAELTEEDLVLQEQAQVTAASPADFVNLLKNAMNKKSNNNDKE